MQQEQYTPQSQAFDDQPARKMEGTPLEHGANIGIDVGEMARRKKIASALADVNAAMQPTQPPVEETQEHAQDTFEQHKAAQIEVIRQSAYGMVYGFRKPQTENSLGLFSTDDNESAAPYLQSQDSTTEDLFKEAA